MPSPDLLIGSITGTLTGVIVTRLWLWWPTRKKLAAPVSWGEPVNWNAEEVRRRLNDGDGA